MFIVYKMRRFIEYTFEPARESQKSSKTQNRSQIRLKVLALKGLTQVPPGCQIESLN
jgi:hypothetical protein